MIATRSTLAAFFPVALLMAACANVSTAPERAEALVAQVSIRPAEAKELSRFRVGVENPFVEHRSILHKPDYRFVVFAVEGGRGLAGLQVESLRLSSAGAPVQSSILYSDDLKSYWWSFSSDERETMEMQRTIELLVPDRKPRRSARPRQLWYLVVKAKDTGAPIDGWRASLLVGGEAIELEGSF